MNTASTLSRRSFVAGTAFAAGAAAASCVAPALADEAAETTEGEAAGPQLPSFLEAPEPIADDQISETYDADVVVVGMGLAGVAAARTAAEAGLKVVSIERSSDVNARSSQFSCFNCDAAREMGIEDFDTTDLVNELMIQMGHRPDARVLKNWADNAGEAFEWYAGAVDGLVWVKPGEEQPNAEENPDLIWVANNNLYAPYDHEVDHECIFTGTLSFRPNGHLPVLKLNRDAAVATGNLTDIYDMRALQLTKDGDRVNGVIAQSIADGSYIKVNAAKAVILATGDYLNNDDMLAYYMPWIYWQKDKFSFTYMSVDLNVEKTDVGDGHRMGYWAGGNIEAGPHCAMAHGDLGKLGVAAFLQLNARGERYVNEDLTNDHFGSQIIRQPDCTIYQIFDADVAEEITHMQGGLGSKQSISEADLETIDEWTAAKGDTVEELVANLGVDETTAANMVREIARYNELCEKGHDDDFGKAPERMMALDHAPFYAIRYEIGNFEEGQNALRCLVGMSGLSSNKYGQVLNSNFDPVPGLFAVGNVQGGRFLGDYPATIAGASHSIALTYGRIAAKYIAENL